jgi:hypothetical protein
MNAYATPTISECTSEPFPLLNKWITLLPFCPAALKATPAPVTLPSSRCAKLTTNRLLELGAGHLDEPHGQDHVAVPRRPGGQAAGADGEADARRHLQTGTRSTGCRASAPRLYAKHFELVLWLAWAACKICCVIVAHACPCGSTIVAVSLADQGPARVH